MWDDNRAGDVGLAPAIGENGGALTFGGWYVNWLNEAEQAVSETRRQSRSHYAALRQAPRASQSPSSP